MMATCLGKSRTHDSSREDSPQVRYKFIIAMKRAVRKRQMWNNEGHFVRDRQVSAKDSGS
jgi:hypothetical protein